MQTLFFPNTSTELLRVNVDDIIYVEADGNYCMMHLKGDIIQNLWFNMKHFSSLIEEQMKDDMPVFIEVGRSLIINRKYIYRINPRKGDLILFGAACSDLVNLHASVAALEQLWKYIQSVEKVK